VVERTTEGTDLMGNFKIWIRSPYPFRYDEIEAIQDALRATYTHNIVYLREWPIDYVSIDETNITTCKQIALTLKTIHRQWAIQDKKNTGRAYCQELDIVIQDRLSSRPEWAQIERTKDHE
jgi:hypothetical protein